MSSRTIGSLSFLTILLIIVLSLFTSLQAVSHVHSNIRPLIPRFLPLYMDSATVHNALLLNAPEEFSGDNVSDLVVTSRNGKFILGFGGYVKATASFDFGNPVDDPTSFITSQIPFDTPPGSGGKFAFSAQTSSLYANFVANPGEHQVGAFLGANLLGENYLPQLQYAFIRYMGWQAGYDYTLFSDPSAAPPSIDFEGPNSYLAIPSVGIRWSRAFGRGQSWRAGISAEAPQASVTAGMMSESVTQRIPDIPAFIRFSWAGGDSWVRLSAILRNICYRDVAAASNRYSTGWGFSLSGSASLLPDRITAFWQAAAGRGISSYFQDLTDMGLDLLPDRHRPGHLRATPSWGAFGGLQFNFSERFFASASYSHLRIYSRPFADPSGSYPSTYRYGQYAVANLFYNISSSLQCGLEYNWGRRVNFDGASRHDSRIQTMLQFSF